MQYAVSFPTGKVDYYFGSTSKQLDTLHYWDSIAITDSNIAALYPELLKRFKAVITIPAGEQSKQQETVTHIIDQLIAHEAHRKTRLIGIGGGVVTDITGYVAGTYMRGVPFGFIPTSLLGMVDAAIGGKNGINYKQQKNLIGTIRQPQFLLFDTQFLQTLPDAEWSNGFAEIIKYACLFDTELFETVSKHNIHHYKNNSNELQEIINTCVQWKNKTVLDDEQESGKRKLLNFGHTVGHAIEAQHKLPHGQAISLGMLVATLLSIEQSELNNSTYEQLSKTLKQYDLPTKLKVEVVLIMEILKMDKKRSDEGVDFILINSIGNSLIKTLPFTSIEKALIQFNLLD